MTRPLRASPWLWAPAFLLGGCLMSRLSVDEGAGSAGGAGGAMANGGGNKPSGAGGTDDPSAGASSGSGAADSGGSAAGGAHGGAAPNGDAGSTVGGEDNIAGSSSAGGSSAGSGGSSGGSGGSGAVATCTNPTTCIDEVASTSSSFGNAGWKDSWWVIGCATKTGYDCANVTSCSTAGATPEDRGSRTVETWELGGEKGQHYKVTFLFNGVTEAKLYTTGTRDAPTQANPQNSTGLDMFYRDGTSPLSNYGVLKLTVYDDTGAPVRHYYMNSAAEAGWENHNTYLASYQKSIVVVGRGKIEHLVQDNNCRPVDNCGPVPPSDSSCPAPRHLPGDAKDMLLPGNYQDPNDGAVKSTLLLVSAYPSATLAQPWHAQASHLTIQAIVKTDDPVDKNY
jgi:hypothetical protein